MERKTYYSAPGHQGKELRCSFWTRASLSDLGQVTPGSESRFPAPRSAGPAFQPPAPGPRRPSAGALQAERPAPSRGGFRAPLPSEPPRGDPREQPRERPLAAPAQRSHNPLGLLPGRAPSPWLPLRLPPCRAARVQPRPGWRGQRAGPRQRSYRSADHTQAPGRGALGAAMMHRLSPAPWLTMLSLIGLLPVTRMFTWPPGTPAAWRRRKRRASDAACEAAGS